MKIILALFQVPKAQPVALISSPEDSQHYEEARQCVEELALYLKPLSNTRGTEKIQETRECQSESFIEQIFFTTCLCRKCLQVWASAARHKAY